MKNIFGENIFLKNSFVENIFGKNMFGKNIYFLPFPHLTALQTTPTSSQLLISDFEVQCDRRNKLTDSRTGRTHTRIVSFIVLD